MEWLGSLISADDFVSRSHCGTWDQFHLRLYQVANVTIAVAYFALPLMLLLVGYPLRLARSGVRISHESLRALLAPWAMFIGFCGAGHFLDGYLSFFHPAYRLWAWWHAATAVVSIWAWWVTQRQAAISVRAALERDE